MKLIEIMFKIQINKQIRERNDLCEERSIMAYLCT